MFEKIYSIAISGIQCLMNELRCFNISGIVDYNNLNTGYAKFGRFGKKIFKMRLPGMCGKYY